MFPRNRALEVKVRFLQGGSFIGIPRSVELLKSLLKNVHIWNLMGDPKGDAL